MSFSTITTELPLSAICITKFLFFYKFCNASNSLLKRCCKTIVLLLQQDDKRASLILLFINLCYP